MLLRLLFPSWAFFDAVTDVPMLEARVGDTLADGADWRPVLHAPRRAWRQLLYNPEGNAHLALQAVVDRFAVECEQGAPHDISRALIESLAEDVVRLWPDAKRSGACWAWRVVARDVAAVDASDKRVLFESHTLTFATMKRA